MNLVASHIKKSNWVDPKAQESHSQYLLRSATAALYMLLFLSLPGTSNISRQI